ncbi:hypothetical protein HP532_01545 [Pseudomonas sp. CrR25]|nr:hypothetical protein [Pseudomonas sp. CrR25]
MSKRKAAKAAVESPARPALPPGAVACDLQRLAPNNSYGTAFMLRGYYLDEPFQCRDCGSQEIWRASQQQWWYEVAKGEVNSGAVRCRRCRRRERERQAEARRVQLEGLVRKQAGTSP